MKIKFLFLTALLLTVTTIGFAQAKKPTPKPAPKTTTTTPEQVVKDLYAEHKADKGPFNQNKSRAAIDKYFIKVPGSAVTVLGDVIWKLESDKNSTGFDFDPLYYTQDPQITDFVVGNADKDNKVTVKFKNFGKDEEIIFSLAKENAASKVWKIDSIVYDDAEDLASILDYSMMSEADKKTAEKENKLDGDYMVGSVKCNISSTRNGFWARVQCDDQENVQVIDLETMTFGTFNPKEKGRKGHFVSPEYGVVTKFVDASGKEIKVTRIK